jgi:hypothetical protein
VGPRLWSRPERWDGRAVTTSSRSPGWRSLPSSSIVDALYEDEDIEDVVVLSGAAAPEWLRQLETPAEWQVLGLPAVPEQLLARMAVFGPLGDGEWEAADTIHVTGFTGWPAFYDMYRSADGVLRALGSTDIEVKALPVPPIQWTAAVRSSGTALFGDRSVWLQQTHYGAGSEQPHASRLTTHTILVDSARQEQLAENIIQLSDEVYHGFLDALPTERRAL